MTDSPDDSDQRPSARDRLLGTTTIRRGVLNGNGPAPKTKPPIRAARSVATSVQKAAAPSYRSHGETRNALLAAWPEIVGETLAHMTRPEHYQPGRGAANNGVLTVRVAGALALDLQHLEPQIVERVNGHFGYRAIARLKIVQGPLPAADTRLTGRTPLRLTPEDRRAAADHAAGIEDDALRRRLQSLAAAVLARARQGD